MINGQHIPIIPLQPIVKQELNKNYPSSYTGPVMKRCLFDVTTKEIQQTMIMGQITGDLRDSNKKEYDIDMAALAYSLGNLIPRLMRIVLDVIYEYNLANPSRIQVMGKQSDMPFRGMYNKAADYSEFDLCNFPDSLIIILDRFVTLTKIHAK
jgi:hypothetical protein